MIIFDKLKQKIKSKLISNFYSLYLKLNHIDRRYPRKVGISEKLYDNKKIIVTLTSFPERINTIHLCIYTLMHQLTKPNAIVLWLAEEQFPQKEKNLPVELLQLVHYGLSIRWIKNDLKSYKKLLPALKDYPDDILITADDDLYYPRYWIKNLLKSYEQNPNEIHCHLITPLEISDGGKFVKTERVPSMQNTSSFNYKLLSGSGTLFPPNSLDEKVMNFEKAYALAPTSDDIWFWAMGVKAGVRIRWIKKNMKELYYLEGVQESTPCLWKVNDQGEKLFDLHLNSVIENLGITDMLTNK